MWWKRHRVPEAKAEILEVAEFFVSPLDHRIYACGYDEHAVDFAVILDGLLGTEVTVSQGDGRKWVLGHSRHRALCGRQRLLL